MQWNAMGCSGMRWDALRCAFPWQMQVMGPGLPMSNGESEQEQVQNNRSTCSARCTQPGNHISSHMGPAAGRVQPPHGGRHPARANPAPAHAVELHLFRPQSPGDSHWGRQIPMLLDSLASITPSQQGQRKAALTARCGPARGTRMCVTVLFTPWGA